MSDLWANRGTKRDKAKNQLLGDGKSKAPVLTQEFREVRIYKSPEPDDDDLFAMLERTTAVRLEDQRVDPRAIKGTVASRRYTRSRDARHCARGGGRGGGRGHKRSGRSQRTLR